MLAVGNFAALLGYEVFPFRLRGCPSYTTHLPIMNTTQLLTQADTEPTNRADDTRFLLFEIYSLLDTDFMVQKP